MQKNEQYRKLQARLAAYSRKQRLVAFGEKLFYFCTGAALVGLVLPLLYWFAGGDAIFRWLLSIASAGAALYFGFRLVVRPLWDLLLQAQKPGADRIALLVGKKYPDIKDSLSNALQIVRDNPGAEHESPVLAWAAFERVARKIDKLDFAKSISLQRLRSRAWRFLGVLVLGATAYGLFPAQYNRSLAWFINPMRAEERAQVQFTVLPGDAEVVRGESLTVSVTLNGNRFAPPQLRASYEGGKFVDELSLDARGEADFWYKFSNVTEPFSYRIRSGDSETPAYRVRVIDLPDVRELRLTLTPPRYTRLPVQALEPNVGNISVLPGTKVHLNLKTNKPVEDAKIAFDQADTLQFERTEGEYAASFVARREDSYRIALRDAKGLVNRDPIEYQINLIPDQSPIVQITYPGQDMDIDESMEVPLNITGEDDFGFSKLRLKYSLYRSGAEVEAGSGSKEVPFNVADLHLEATFLWNFVDLGLLPEDVVVYHVELFDNDYVSGPKKAVSQLYRLRFPSIDEIFQEVAQDQSEATDSMQDFLEKSREIKSDVNEVLQEVRREMELSWEDKQKLKESLDKQEDIANRLEQIQENLEETLDRLERNDLLSMETVEKYQELQKLLDEIASPELKKMMQKLQEALQDIDPRKLEKALEEFQFSQEEFLQNMERTINMLKQLQAEQKLDEAIKTAEEMLEQQEKINDSMPEAKDPADVDDLVQAEQKQAERLENLQKSLEELRQSAQELPQMQLPEEQISNAQDIAESQQLSSDLQQASQMMQQGQMQTAQESGERAAQSMQQMRDMLSQAQQQMQQNQRAEVMQALRRSSRNFLELSKKQEQLARESGSQSSASSKYRDIADQQQDVLSAMNRTTEQLFQLSQKSFFVPPGIGQKLGKSMSEMQKAINELEERRAMQAAKEQSKAMQSLNGAIADVRQAMKDLSGSSSGSGMEQFMQRMMGITGEQRGLNNQTRGLGENGQLSLAQQASLPRLAAQQRALQEQLQQLQKEFGGQGEILGDLQKVADDMKDVADELRRKQVSRRTIERQERILSRLLDAQKSARERDFSKKRRAQTAKVYRVADPGALPANLGEGQQKIQQDLLRAMKENYSRDYKILIQKYFEALAKALQDGDASH